MTALLIGGTGTISMAISRQLLEEGHDLYLVNRGNRNDELTRNNVQYLTCDINDEDKMAQLLQGHKFDVVADFIAFTPEQLAGDPVTIVRPSHTYDERSIPLGVHGAKGSWSVAKRILDGKPVIIHGDGSSLWTMTHNSDFAKGFIGLMGNMHAIGEAVQIMSDESLTWNQIYVSIAKVLGKELKAVHVPSEFLAATSDYDFEGGLIGDKANTVVFDNTKIKRLVPDFTAAIRFDQGIKSTVDYVVAHPELQKEDPEFDAYCDKVIDVLEEAKEKLRSGM